MIKRYLTAYFEDEEQLLEAVRSLKQMEFSIQDVLTPFPVHGLDRILGYKQSRIPTVGFIGGVIGASLAFGFQSWVFVVDYPIQIGGKPHFAIPSFIPITFELTVLCAAFAMGFAFLIRSRLGLGAPTVIHDERITDDRFLIVVDLPDEELEGRIALARDLLEKQEGRNILVKEVEKS